MYAFIRQLKIGVDYVLQKFLLPSWLVSFFLLIYLYFGSAGSSLLHNLFSSCGKQALTSICGTRASHGCGFSCCRARVLGHAGFSGCNERAH